MRRLPLLFPALVLLLAAPSVAFADPEPEVSDEGAPAARNPWDRWLAIELVGGADTPYGVLGGSVRLLPHRNIMIDLGAGSSRDGVRVAGGVAFTVPDREFAFQVRGGIAGGPMAWDSSFATADGAGGTAITRPVHRWWDFAPFLDLDLALEWRHPEGFGGRIFFGVEQNLIARADSCSFTDALGAGGNCDPGVVTTRPIRVYAGISIGYSFDMYR